MEATFYFQIIKDGKPGVKQAYNVTTDGLLTDDIATEMHLKKLAQNYAKVLNALCTQPVRYFMKGDEANAISVDVYDEESNSKETHNHINN